MRFGIVHFEKPRCMKDLPMMAPCRRDELAPLSSVSAEPPSARILEGNSSSRWEEHAFDRSDVKSNGPNQRRTSLQRSQAEQSVVKIQVLNNYRVWSRFRELSLGRRARPQNLNSNYIIIYIKYRLTPTNTAANPKLISVFPPAPVYG